VREDDPTFFDRLRNQQQPEFLWIGCSDSRVPVRDAGAVSQEGPGPRGPAVAAECGVPDAYTMDQDACEPNTDSHAPTPTVHPLQANQILGLAPGEIFVQRNVGNLALHTDMNLMACLEYAVKSLKVGLGGGGCGEAWDAARSLGEAASHVPQTHAPPVHSFNMEQTPAHRHLGTTPPPPPPPQPRTQVKTVLLCGHYHCGAVKAALQLPSCTPGLVNCWISDIREARNQAAPELAALGSEERVSRLCELNVLRQVFHVCTSPVVQAAWADGQELHVWGVSRGCGGVSGGEA